MQCLDSCRGIPGKGGSRRIRVGVKEGMARKEILKDYTYTSYQTAVMSVPVTSNGENITRFAIMNKYFKWIITVQS